MDTTSTVTKTTTGQNSGSRGRVSRAGGSGVASHGACHFTVRVPAGAVGSSRKPVGDVGRSPKPVGDVGSSTAPWAPSGTLEMDGSVGSSRRERDGSTGSCELPMGHRSFADEALRRNPPVPPSRSPPADSTK